MTSPSKDNSKMLRLLVIYVPFINLDLEESHRCFLFPGCIVCIEMYQPRHETTDHQITCAVNNIDYFATMAPVKHLDILGSKWRFGSCSWCVKGRINGQAHESILWQGSNVDGLGQSISKTDGLLGFQQWSLPTKSGRVAHFVWSIRRATAAQAAENLKTAHVWQVPEHCRPVIVPSWSQCTTKNAYIRHGSISGKPWSYSRTWPGLINSICFQIMWTEGIV